MFALDLMPYDVIVYIAKQSREPIDLYNLLLSLKKFTKEQLYDELETHFGIYIYNEINDIPKDAKFVIIEEGITEIKNDAFCDYNHLSYVYIPDSVTIIGDAAFYGCRSLTSVVIPDKVTSIGEFAFYFCESLTSVVIGKSVTTIMDYGFSGCNKLTSIIIPHNNLSIKDCAFYWCDRLSCVQLAESVSLSHGSFPYHTEIIRV